VFWGFTYIINLIALYFAMMVTGFSPKKKAYVFGPIVAVSLVLLFTFSVKEHPEWMLIRDALVITAIPFGIKGKNKIISTFLSYTVISLSFIQSLLMFALENSGLELFTTRHMGWGFLAFYMNEEYHARYILSGLLTIFIVAGIIIIYNVIKKRPLFDFMMFDFKRLEKRFLILLQSVFIGLALISSIVQAILTYGSSGTVVERIATLLLCGSAIVIVALISKSITEQSEKNSYKERAHINEMLVEKQREYYDLLLKQEEETKKFRHDINYHFSCFKYFLENELYSEAKDYIDDVVSDSAGLKPVLETGNRVLNVVVSDILNRFDGNKFKISWKGFFPAESKISSADICVIFSNTLTNAVEAIYRLQSQNIETINVIVKCIGEHLFVSISNPSAGSIRTRGRYFHTDKPEKSVHGFGTQIIIERVEKYGGTVEFTELASSFTVEMTFNGVIVI